jgi:hypothetical protein
MRPALLPLPPLALLALLLAAPAARAQPVLLDHWPMEQGSSGRYGSIRYVNGQRPDNRNRASVFEYYLGDSDMAGHELYAHATPVTTANRLVVVTDVVCNLLAFSLPEDLPQQLAPVRAAWAPLWTWSGAASDPAQPDPECSSAVADGSRVYFLSRQRSQVVAIETASGSPVPLAWSPAPLDPRYFGPGSFAAHGTGLILRNWTLWVPAHEGALPGVLSIDVRTGSQQWSASNVTAAGLNQTQITTKSFAGSVSASNQDAAINAEDTSAIFFVNGEDGTDPLEFFQRGIVGGGPTWRSSTHFQNSSRIEHPNLAVVTNVLGRVPTNCVLLVDTNPNPAPNSWGIKVDAIDHARGQKCKQWPNNGWQLSNSFVAQAEWISTGAYLRETGDNPNPLIFFTTRLPNTRASLSSWIITNSGLVLRDGHLYTGAPTCAPVMLRHAYGQEYHAIIFPGPGGQLQSFDAWAISEGPQYSINLRRWNDRDQLRILGPYMAATQGGSALFITRTTGRGAAAGGKNFSLYVYGVSHAQFQLPVAPSASPSTTPSTTPTATGTGTSTRTSTATATFTPAAQPPAAAAAADAPSSPATVAAGLFGGLFAAAAAAVAVAVFLPASLAARLVRGGAAAAASALSGTGRASGGGGHGGGLGGSVAGTSGASAPLVFQSAPAAAERLGLLAAKGPARV